MSSARRQASSTLQALKSALEKSSAAVADFMDTLDAAEKARFHGELEYFSATFVSEVLGLGRERGDVSNVDVLLKICVSGASLVKGFCECCISLRRFVPGKQC